ncbi:TolC family protein [Sphingomonas sp. MA1305]|jgi:cobalt-zinc-cadmium efflux system outer membrane protein|uniref:TolC family protein n=1 Tax=unclassified Sphingomonas TaxID=196159 RepID=UPI0018DF7AC8|nr:MULTISPECIES: TolC family protein [unclassified Sphingomonas]MBI0476980.1 TolC family protein [Sphingomonas sp. MA1305]MCP4025520.1 TolC family protein [Sphingomonas sp.]
MRFTLPAAAILAASMPACAEAQSALSLDALVQDVVANNPERQFYQRQIETAGIERQAAGRWADPEVVAEFGERKANDRATGGLLGEGQTYAVSIVQPIEFGGRIALRRAIAERQVELARVGLRQFEATLAARARTLGYGLFAADEKAAAARIVASRARTLAHVIVSRDPAGPAPTLEAAALQASAISAERTAAMADAEANSILYELNQLRAAPFPSRIRIIRPDMTLPDLPAPTMVAEKALANNFELKALRVQFEQQGLRVDLARKARLPVVTVGPYFDRARSDIRETNYGVRLSTTIPLWNAQAGQVAAEQGRQAQANATLIAAERKLMRDVYDQVAQYEAKRRALGQWEENTPARFAAAAEEADRNFRLGAIPIATYTQLQQAYIDATNAVLDTRREALDALLQLRALNAGDPLSR